MQHHFCMFYWPHRPTRYNTEGVSTGDRVTGVISITLHPNFSYPSWLLTSTSLRFKLHPSSGNTSSPFKIRDGVPVHGESPRGLPNLTLLGHHPISSGATPPAVHLPPSGRGRTRSLRRRGARGKAAPATPRKRPNRGAVCTKGLLIQHLFTEPYSVPGGMWCPRIQSE